MRAIRVLWVSRHPPLPAQLRELERVYGRIDIKIASKSFPAADDVVKAAREWGADVIVPVLPLSFVARLCEVARREGFTVLWAEMQSLHTPCPEAPCKDFSKDTDVILPGPPSRHFRFKRFQRIKAVRLELEPVEG